MLGVGKPSHPDSKPTDPHTLIIECLALVLAQILEEICDVFTIDETKILNQLKRQPAGGSFQRCGLQIVKNLHSVTQMRAGPFFNPLTNFFAVGPLQHIVVNDLNPGKQQAFALDQVADLIFPPQQLTRFGESKSTVVVGQ